MNDFPTMGHGRSAKLHWFKMFDVQVWISYSTVVAFQVGNNAMVVRQNSWGPTTGRHLNGIDNGHKERRVDTETFNRLWELQTLRFYGTNQEESVDYGSPDYQPFE